MSEPGAPSGPSGPTGPRASSGATGKEVTLDVTVPDIDRCIHKGIYDKTFSGAACIGSVGGKIFHRGIYGTPKAPPPAQKLDYAALFDLASLSKPLGAGLAALVLASQNRLDLGAPLSKTLPELKKAPHFEKITIDMLLDHTAGFPATRKLYEQLAEVDAKQKPNEKLLGTRKAVPLAKELLAEGSLEYEPGSKCIYSDLGFLLLGWIIESVVGKPLDQYLEKEIYGPLGIAQDLFFVRQDDVRQRKFLNKRVFVATEDCPWRKKLMQGEVHDPNAWAIGGVAGHAGLFGTVDAVWKLTTTLLGSFHGTDRTFLSGTVRRFWAKSKRVRNTTRTLAWDTPSYGSSAGKRFSLNSIGHLGFTGCSIWVDLSTDVTGVFLANSVYPTVEGKQQAMQTFRPRLYELIGKEGETAMQGQGRAVGAAAFYDGDIKGPGRA